MKYKITAIHAIDSDHEFLEGGAQCLPLWIGSNAVKQKQNFYEGICMPEMMEMGVEDSNLVLTTSGNLKLKGMKV